MRHRLRIPQVSVRVEKADLAAEERARLRTLEASLQAAVVRQRSIEEPGAVGGEQLPTDLPDVSLGLLAREGIGKDPVDHRQQASMNAGLAVVGVQPRVDAAVVA